jgi:hypothetical protein
MKHIPLLFLLGISPILLPAESAPLRILRVGDSITRYAASDASLGQQLTEAGIDHDFVGSQRWPGTRHDSDCEGYNGKRIRFFIHRQDGEFGHRDTPNKDAVPIDLALERFQPDVVLLMIGANDLGGPAGPEIDVKALSAQYNMLLDRIREKAPEALLVVATVTPADASYQAWERMEHRNQRVRAFNEHVVKPAVSSRIDQGESIVLADMFPALDPDKDLSDGVHPNERGKKAINRVWAEALTAALRDREPVGTP